MTKEVELIAQDVSAREAEEVSTAMRHLLRFVGGKDLPLEKVTTDLLEGYQRMRLKKASLNTYRREICYFIRMLERNGFTVKKPKPKRGKETPNRAFTQEELEAFFGHCGFRLWVLFMTMLVTGARPAELIPSNRSKHTPLLKSELFDDLNIKVRNAKIKPLMEKNTFRMAAIPPTLMEDLRYVASLSDVPYVFPERGNSLAASFNGVIERAGIAKIDELRRKVTAHSFRHTFCENLAARVGNNPFVVMGAMGHSNITSTQIYCHGATQLIDLEALFATRPPREQEKATPRPWGSVNGRKKKAVGKGDGENGKSGEASEAA